MSLVVQTDGGSRGNPGLSAAAFFIPSLDVRVGIPLSDSTNNVAEYMGLIEALKYVHRFVGRCELEIQSDSKLMVQQMKGVYQVKSETLLHLWAEATALAEEHFTAVSYTHVPREENRVADSIANMTMDHMLRYGSKDLIHFKTA